MTISVTLVIILVTCLVSFLSFNRPLLKAKLLHNPYKVKHHQEYHRLITSGFIHSNTVHLGFNMFTLFFFGQNVEAILIAKFGFLSGEIYYVLFYLISIILSDLSSVVKFGDSPHFNSLGASGAVSAVLFVSIVFNPLDRLLLMGFIPARAFILGALYLIYSYTQGKKMTDNINHNAHLYGALAGIAFSMLIQPSIIIEFFQKISTYSFF